ncbi:MAG: HAMP domain-containing sensor histidine kinase [Candidatus Eisenbacteria bacterium]
MVAEPAPPSRRTHILFLASWLALAAVLLGAWEVAGWLGAHSTHGLRPVWSKRWGPNTSGDVSDFDGDGRDELVTMSEPGGSLSMISLAGATAGEGPQRNPGPDHPRWRKVRLLPCTDIDGDGLEEVLLEYVVEDSVRLRAYDADLRIVADTYVSSGVDATGDRFWDGKIQCVASMDLGESGWGVAVSAAADRDRLPREIILFDSGLQGVLWRHPGGAQVRSLRAVDLDDDGIDELAFASAAPCNGAVFAGTADTASYAGVLTAGGELLWCEQLGGPVTSVLVAAADLTEQAGSELITMTTPERQSHPPLSRLAIREGMTGRLVDEVTFPGHGGIPLAYPDRTGRSRRIAVCASSSEILWFSVSDGQLHLDRSIELAERTRLESLHPRPGSGSPWILTVLSNGRLAAAVPFFKLRAVYEPSGDPPEGQEVGFLGSYRDGTPGEKLLVISDGWHLLQVVRLWPPVSWVALSIAVSGVVSAGIWYETQRKKVLSALAGLIRGPSPRVPVDRDFLGLALLGELEMGQHDKMLVTRPLRALHRVTTIMQDDPEMRDDLADLALQSLQNYCEFTKPSVAKILELADAWSAEERGQTRLRTALESVDEETDDLSAALADVHPARLSSAALSAIADELESALATLRASVAADYLLDVRRELERSLQLCREDADDAGLDLSLECDIAPGTLCHASPRGFQMAVSNLMSNAIRATAGEKDPSLSISVEWDESHVILRFTDNGCGIPNTEWERVFDYGRTTRAEGGGKGLYYSREILKPLGGSIRVERSSPGEGTTFRVAMRRVAEADRLTGRT